MWLILKVVSKLQIKQALAAAYSFLKTYTLLNIINYPYLISYFKNSIIKFKKILTSVSEEITSVNICVSMFLEVTSVTASSDLLKIKMAIPVKVDKSTINWSNSVVLIKRI